MATLTEAQLQHFASTFVWLAMVGGAIGSLAFGMFMLLITRVIASMGGWVDRCRRIYIARMRANALRRTNGNG